MHLYVYSGADAKKALDYGVKGIIVSNHGGRQLDSAVSTVSCFDLFVFFAS